MLNLVQVNPAPVPAPVIEPPQAVLNRVQINPAPVQAPAFPVPIQTLTPTPTLKLLKPTIIVPTNKLLQPEPQPQIEDHLANIPELEDDSNPVSPEPPTLLQKPVIRQPQLPPAQKPIPGPQQVPQGIQKVIDEAILQRKIQGFGAKERESIYINYIWSKQNGWMSYNIKQELKDYWWN